jgi:hypothetical protein
MEDLLNDQLDLYSSHPALKKKRILEIARISSAILPS